MARLTMAQRKRMPSSSFALPGKGKGPSGKGSGSYPIGDITHARNALARASGKPVEAQVRRKVHAKYPSIGKQMGGMIPKAPKPPQFPVPKIGPLVGARPPRPPRAAFGRVGGRLSSAAGMHGGGVTGVSYAKKPHTYAGGGVVDRIGREALTGKREMTPNVKSHSGDQAPATCGNLKGHGGFADFGIKRSH